MKLTINKIDPELVNRINNNVNALKKSGVKINQSEYVIGLVEAALDGGYAEYKRDVFDTTIDTLINKFDEYVKSNNELLSEIIKV